MDDHPDCVSTCTPLHNQLCHLCHLVTYTWVALLLRRPFLAIESCFVHLNQVVDHFKLKSRDGVFWMEVYQRLSEFAHTQMEKVWSRIILVHNNFFFKFFDVCLCNVLVLCYYFFFFNFRIIILVDRKCWLSGHNHLYIIQGHIIVYFLWYQFDVCFFSNVCQEYVFLVFFSTFIWFFFSPQTCVDSVGATIFTFPVVIQLNVFSAVPNHFAFWKSKFSFYKFQLEGGNAVIFHARHENDLKTKQTESEGI